MNKFKFTLTHFRDKPSEIESSYVLFLRKINLFLDSQLKGIFMFLVLSMKTIKLPFYKSSSVILWGNILKIKTQTNVPRDPNDKNI